MSVTCPLDLQLPPSWCGQRTTRCAKTRLSSVSRRAVNLGHKPTDRDLPFRVGCNAVLEPMAANAVQSFETAGIHHPCRRRGGRLAACGARAAAGGADDRAP